MWPEDARALGEHGWQRSWHRRSLLTGARPQQMPTVRQESGPGRVYVGGVGDEPAALPQQTRSPAWGRGDHGTPRTRGPVWGTDHLGKRETVSEQSGEHPHVSRQTRDGGRAPQLGGNEHPRQARPWFCRLPGAQPNGMETTAGGGSGRASGRGLGGALLRGVSGLRKGPQRAHWHLPSCEDMREGALTRHKTFWYLPASRTLRDRCCVSRAVCGSVSEAPTADTELRWPFKSYITALSIDHPAIIFKDLSGPTKSFPGWGTSV